ncbi:MAG: serine/threonine protein kinase [Gemmataceae bacterium]|nr:serine/threonine protein kinase [Gemmataceae bacterium]
MASPIQQTADYHGQPAAGPEPGRFQVAIIRGSGSGRGEDLYRLLKRRLRIFVSYYAVSYALGVVITAVATLSQGPTTGSGADGFFSDLWGEKGDWIFLLSVIMSVGTAALLWLRPPATIRGLRAVELAFVGYYVIGMLIATAHPRTYRDLQRAVEKPPDWAVAEIAAYTYAIALIWVQFLVLYSVLVPNTGRRNAVVVGGAAVGWLTEFAVLSLWIKPLPTQTVFIVLSNLGFYFALVAAVSVFAAYRIEYLRRQAAEARKLGQYVLRERLGSGGMGEVYRAEHVLLRRPCAIKLIRPERAGDPDALRRFEREVQITATLTHPNTVQVFDYGHTTDGTFYYVMEYLPGLTLDDLVRQDGPLPPGRAVHFLRQVCAALGEAHTRGLTHRDIKPGNVMVCERGGVPDVAKLLDFGLVRAPTEDADGGTLTREGSIAGTPAYMSPEQACGEGGIDPRSDLYSVGALAYFLLSGQPLFAGRTAAKVLAAHLYEPPALLPAEVPGDLASVVMRCLAKAPSERWPDSASLEEALAVTSVPVWTAGDATAWWARARGTGCEPRSALATATWAEPDGVLSSGHFHSS